MPCRRSSVELQAQKPRFDSRGIAGTTSRVAGTWSLSGRLCNRWWTLAESNCRVLGANESCYHYHQGPVMARLRPWVARPHLRPPSWRPPKVRLCCLSSCQELTAPNAQNRRVRRVTSHFWLAFSGLRFPSGPVPGSWLRRKDSHLRSLGYGPNEIATSLPRSLESLQSLQPVKW